MFELKTGCRYLQELADGTLSKQVNLCDTIKKRQAWRKGLDNADRSFPQNKNHAEKCAPDRVNVMICRA